MSQWLAQNLAALRARDPQLADRVAQCDPSAVEVVRCDDGLTDLRWQGTLLDGGTPRSAAERLVAQTDVPNPRLVFFYGLGLGHHVRMFLQQPRPKTIGILLVERSLACFRRALETADWSAILADPRVEWFVDIPSDALPHAVVVVLRKPDLLVGVRAIVPVCHEAVMRIDAQYYVHVAEQVRLKTQEIEEFYVLGSPEDGFRGFVNVMTNLPHCAELPPFDPLEGAFSGVPGIAISTGPSLAHSFEWLRQVGDRAVTLCSDSCLRILLQQKITPHGTACLERVPETKLLFDGLPPLPETWCFMNPIVWPETFQGYPGPKALLMRSTSPLQWCFPDWKHYDMGNSVSHQMLLMLQKMGCNPILLVGQDLAFDRHSDRTHVAGIPDLLYQVGQKQRADSEQRAVARRDDECLVEGNNGEPILTMRWYNAFRMAFEVFIQAGKTPVYNVIPKDYGAKIPGAHWCPPTEALSLLGETHPIRSHLRTTLAATGDSPAAFHRKAFARLQRMHALLTQYAQASMDVLNAVSQFRQRHNPNYFGAETFRPLFTRVEQIARSMAEDPEDFFAGVLSAVTQGPDLLIAQRAEELLKEVNPSAAVLEAQVDCIRDWFGSVFTWSARMARHLETTVLSTYPRSDAHA
ncbi:MAG: DUF115 domain-containing protein [Deltaproteobacteria bacterium]|nr:DUF115 domain-containing protein [Deltaproteobacteria bacterium]